MKQLTETKPTRQKKKKKKYFYSHRNQIPPLSSLPYLKPGLKGTIKKALFNVA